FDAQNKRAVHQGKNLPYTVRLSYDERKLLAPKPFSILRFSINGPFPEMKAEELHPLEVKHVALLQGDAMLQWAEILYRSSEPSNVERARELYKGVLFLHGEDPGTMAFSAQAPLGEQNPRIVQQLERARLGLFQIEAGLNFYGYRDGFVPTLRFGTLIDAARRWSGAAKGAQNDYLAYLSRIEQLDLDILAAHAQLKKAQAAAQITGEQIKIAETGVQAAQRLVREVERQITAKQEEIADAESFFGQYSAYLGGLKNNVASIIEVGAWGNEGATTTGAVSDTALREGVRSLGSSAASGVGVAGGLSVVGIMGAFVVLSTIQLQGMADAATKRDKELKLLINESLVAAKAAVQVQERLVTIA
ncbi:MAG TPA: hypothetical protein VFH51_15140, partial [Myxococcota bacterium]|nr:hypothetical protein [Myxococcota bacterium]